jgi:hypothetical protein
MGLAWAAGWAFVGLGIEFVAELDPGFVIASLADIWPTELAIAGLVGGLLFTVLLRIAEGRQAFDDLNPARVALCGALSGLLLGVAAFVGDFGDASVLFPAAWLRGGGMIGSVTALGALSGTGSWFLHRVAGIGAPIRADHHQA